MKKQNPWFRLYGEVLEDPKVQRLNGESFKGWVNLLCLACKRGGRFPRDEVAFSLRLPDKKADELINILLKADLIEIEGETIIPHNWEGRQFRSDDVTERSRKFRERKKGEIGNVPSNGDATLHATSKDRSKERSPQQPENVSATADATPPDTETESETETEPPKRIKRPPIAKSWPKGFSLTENLRAYALSKHVEDVESIWEHFENHHRGKGSRFVDWDRAWFTWIQNQPRFSGGKGRKDESVSEHNQRVFERFLAKGE